MEKKQFKDQMNRRVEINYPPKRVVSIVPSQTEYLYALGLEDEVVGITKFCIHPKKWYKEKNRVGGTKNVNLEKVKALKPDLIIGNKEENDKENIKALEKIAPVWMSDIFTLKDAYHMMLSIGEITKTEIKAKTIINTIQQDFKAFSPQLFNKKFLYLIWQNPSIAVGQSTFINHILTDVFKMKNALGDEQRYPQLDRNPELNPEFVLLSSEPYPFKEKHIEEFQQKYPMAKVILVDGEFFSWYGSRLLEAPRYFIELQKQMVSL